MTGPLRLLRTVLRPTAFRLGVLAGVGSVLLVSGIVVATQKARLPFNIQLIAVGTDLTQHGAATVQLRSDQKVELEQRCRDGCDDLWASFLLPETGYTFRVLDAHGAPVIDDTGTYASGSGSADRRIIAGRETLRVRVSFLEGDGSETPKSILFWPTKPKTADAAP